MKHGGISVQKQQDLQRGWIPVFSGDQLKNIRILIILKLSSPRLLQAPRRILDEEVTVRLSSCSDTIILQTPPVPPRSGHGPRGRQLQLSLGTADGIRATETT